jgi:nitroimidazol reductase NimA-like FMN-containing flavoprotein (pyridoxamine 5'-phosphate oxidase superfamily)
MSPNLRKQIEMTADEVTAFLNEQRTIIMCTIHPNGSVHAVPMFYGLVDGAVVVQTKARAQKVVNLRRNPRLTMLVQAGREYEELRGVELVGRGEILEDPKELWELAVNIHTRNKGPYSEDQRPVVQEAAKNRFGIRLITESVVSWDHRKLAALHT